MTKFELFMGRHKKDGQLVTPGAFQQFLKDYADPKLEGYTVQSGRGYWRGQQEEAYILTVIAPSYGDQDVRNIGAAYCRRFQQDSVYVTSTELDHADLITAEQTQLDVHPALLAQREPAPLGLF